MSDSLDTALWRYALEVYEVNDVRECLHTLQDTYNLSINALIAAMFAASKGILLKENQWLRLLNASQKESEACERARCYRVGLKGDDQQKYEQAKVDELALEQRHLAKLYGILTELMEKIAISSSGKHLAMDNMAHYCELNLAIDGELLVQLQLLARASECHER